MKSYVIIGLGLFGTQTAKQLYDQGDNVLVIDKNPELVEECANFVNRAVVADAKKREVLKQLGVGKCDCAIVAMTSDLATSVLIIMNLKAMGIPEIICKAKNKTDMEVLETLGATNVIIPEQIAADGLCRRLKEPNVLEYIRLSDRYGIIEIKTPVDWRGRSVSQINVRAKYGVNIMAVKQNDTINISFDANHIFTPDDVLVVLGEVKDLSKVQNLKS